MGKDQRMSQQTLYNNLDVSVTGMNELDANKFSFA